MLFVFSRILCFWGKNHHAFQITSYKTFFKTGKDNIKRVYTEINHVQNFVAFGHCQLLDYFTNNKTSNLEYQEPILGSLRKTNEIDDIQNLDLYIKYVYFVHDYCEFSVYFHLLHTRTPIFWLVFNSFVKLWSNINCYNPHNSVWGSSTYLIWSTKDFLTLVIFIHIYLFWPSILKLSWPTHIPTKKNLQCCSTIKNNCRTRSFEFDSTNLLYPPLEICWRD